MNTPIPARMEWGAVNVHLKGNVVTAVTGESSAVLHCPCV